MSDIVEIPTVTDDPSFKLRTELEDVTYIIRLDWNTRVEKWHISIFDADENPLLSGIPLNVDTDLIGPLRIAGLPPGLLMLFDTRGENAEAGRDDLFENISQLLYKESE